MVVASANVADRVVKFGILPPRVYPSIPGRYRADMLGGSTTLLGIEIPSTDPLFLAVVGVHIPLGLICVIVGALAMLNKKLRRHSNLGKIYYWSLLAVAASATFLSAMRWAEDYHLFVFGALSFAFASFGRIAIRRHWRWRVRAHLSGMGLSYILLLVAFYVDNGRQLPVWKNLPAFTYWLLPFAVGLPIIVWALLRHPLARREFEMRH